MSSLFFFEFGLADHEDRAVSGACAFGVAATAAEAMRKAANSMDLLVPIAVRTDGQSKLYTQLRLGEAHVVIQREYIASNQDTRRWGKFATSARYSGLNLTPSEWMACIPKSEPSLEQVLY